MARSEDISIAVTETFQSEDDRQRKMAIQQLIDTWIRRRLCE